MRPAPPNDGGRGVVRCVKLDVRFATCPTRALYLNRYLERPYGGRMVKTHPEPEGRALIKLIEDQGWTVIWPSGRGYIRTRCPCGQHSETIHFTPSGRYWINKRKQFERTPCWKKEETP